MRRKRKIYLAAVGRYVTIGQYVNAVKTAKRYPDEEFNHGLTCWWPVKGREIVRQFFAGVQDRINQNQIYMAGVSGKPLAPEAAKNARGFLLAGLVTGFRMAETFFHADCYWLIRVYDDVEPTIVGRYGSYNALLSVARNIRQNENCDLSDGLYYLFFDAQGCPQVESFSGTELEPIET